ncbi:MAG: hypothetical protein IAF94_27290 [Pirellulaceae bacterium]|nr:hypothetical protein [Pirellulaceae bacterium]
MGRFYGLGAAGGLLPLLSTFVSCDVVVVPPGVVTVLDRFTFASSPQPTQAIATATAKPNANVRFMRESPKKSRDVAAGGPSAKGVRC